MLVLAHEQRETIGERRALIFQATCSSASSACMKSSCLLSCHSGLAMSRLQRSFEARRQGRNGTGEGNRGRGETGGGDVRGQGRQERVRAGQKGRGENKVCVVVSEEESVVGADAGGRCLGACQGRGQSMNPPTPPPMPSPGHAPGHAPITPPATPLSLPSINIPQP